MEELGVQPGGAQGRHDGEKVIVMVGQRGGVGGMGLLLKIGDFTVHTLGC